MRSKGIGYPQKRIAEFGVAYAGYEMGVDFLDFTFHIEKEFKIKLRIEKLDVPIDAKGHVVRDVTGRDVLKWVEVTLIENGREVHQDCWPRVRSCIAKTVQVASSTVSLESRLVADLGFT